MLDLEFLTRGLLEGGDHLQAGQRLRAAELDPAALRTAFGVYVERVCRFFGGTVPSGRRAPMRILKWKTRRENIWGVVAFTSWTTPGSRRRRPLRSRPMATG